MIVKDKHKRMTVDFLEGLLIGQELKEGRGNNRSVMPLDALGRTRATMLYSECGLLLCLCSHAQGQREYRHREMEENMGKDSKVGIDDWNCLS